MAERIIAMKIFTLVLLLSLIFIFSSCNPEIVEESNLPEITISSPVEGSYCANLVEIQGSIDTPEKSDIEVLYYYGTLDTGPEKEIIPDELGEFNFILDTSYMKESFFLVIFAYYPISRELQNCYYHNLKKIKNNSLPSFKLNLDKEIYEGIDEFQLTWEAIPETKEYILSYYINTQYPSNGEIVIKKLKAGEDFEIIEKEVLYTLKVSNIKEEANKNVNDDTEFVYGNLYTFFLKTVPTAGNPTSTSGKIEVIPFNSALFNLELNSTPLGDNNTGIMNQLSWNRIPGTERFEVYCKFQNEYIKIFMAHNTTQYSYISNAKIDKANYCIIPYFDIIY